MITPRYYKEGTDRTMEADVGRSEDYGCYDNRELSWLKFNERVLEEARDPKMPLCERLTFSAIFQSNLDEFFMVRVGSLEDQLLLDEAHPMEELRENKTFMTTREQLSAIYNRVRQLAPIRDRAYKEIFYALEEYGVRQVDLSSQLTNEEYNHLYNYFQRELLPLISPQILDKRHPFPFLKNKDVYALAVLEKAKQKDESKSKTPKDRILLGLIPPSDVFQRLIILPSANKEAGGAGVRFMLVEDLLLYFSPQIFAGYNVLDRALLRVTRNADINTEEALNDYEVDYRDAMEDLLKRRKKLSPVRMELSKPLPENAVNFLAARLELTPEQIFVLGTPLDLSFLFKLEGQLSHQSQLFYPKLLPQRTPMVDDFSPIIPQILQRDLLLSYPYEAMKPFLRLLNEAAKDPQVVSIKITLYRVAGNSKVIEALVNAAENGKDVLALVELRARFDEENNIGWSKRLEEAGCTVIYGLEGLKVHSKLLLITRKVRDKVETITQVGTGNFNEKTATLYTDISLITANSEIGAEAAMVFKSLSLGECVDGLKHLLVAPLGLQNRVLAMIDEEIRLAKNGVPAYVGAKLNSITDKVIIEKLVEASQAGVKIELIVRGICCIVAGVPGKTPTVSVTSIVGRYLEHSRMYLFGAGERQKVYISSADFMTRNTIRRVEVAAPIYDPALKHRLQEMFKVMLRDNVKARIQDNSGVYLRKTVEGVPLNSQEYFFQQAIDKAANLPNQPAAPVKATGFSAMRDGIRARLGKLWHK